MMHNHSYLEIENYQVCKYNQQVSGDVFLSKKNEDNTVVNVLSDGLGSGIKANVPATLSANMAMKFIMSTRDIKKAAEVIIETLPICSERKIGYSTFTVSLIDDNNRAKVIEYDNPEFLYFRDKNDVTLTPELIELKSNPYKKNIINYYEFEFLHGDRMIFFSDGVTQAGMGKKSYPLGWGSDKVREYVHSIIRDNPEISAKDLARLIVNMALFIDDKVAHDDITCQVIYCRKPRKLLLMSGPPIKKDNDRKLLDIIEKHDGMKIIAGGTTADIVARLMNRKINVNIKVISKEVPPTAEIESIDLVTEGILTLCKVATLLETGEYVNYHESNAATQMIDLLLNNDIIEFIVGTKINEVHQDPNMPVEIEIRRSIIRKIKNLLEEKYLKKTFLKFI